MAVDEETVKTPRHGRPETTPRDTSDSQYLLGSKLLDHVATVLTALVLLPLLIPLAVREHRETKNTLPAYGD